MKKLSTSLLANLVATKRKELKLTQQDLADATGINRAQISRLEKEDYLPSIPQLEQLGETLGFEPDEVFVDNSSNKLPSPSPLNIAVAGTGYVGLSIATLLAQHNHVTAVDIVPEKVEMINNKKSPIQDDYIEKYLAEKELDLTATLDGEAAYKNADYVVIFCRRSRHRTCIKSESGSHYGHQVYDPGWLYRVCPQEIQYIKHHLQP